MESRLEYEFILEAERRQPEVLQQLEALVESESPSDDKAAVDRTGNLVCEWFGSLGGKVRRRRQKSYGDLIEARFDPPMKIAARKRAAAPKPILVLGHLDTVWPAGTLASMPFRVRKGRAYGPGIFDMKAGIVMAVQAMTMLRDAESIRPPVIVLLNSEEEIGSPCSRAVTEKIARRCAAVYVLEPAQGPAGAYKTARKGVGEYSVRVRGVAAHSGVDFEAGHSAILELARMVGKISRFTDSAIGLTVNPGLIRGGTRVNMVAAEAQAEIDVRIARLRDAARVDRLFRSLRVEDPGCTLSISGGMNRPPMERGPGTIELFRRAKALAARLGFQLEEAATGGGSDGNFTAALGIPTLDGMGAVGEGAHAAHESIRLDMLAPRTALLARMIAGSKPE